MREHRTDLAEHDVTLASFEILGPRLDQPSHHRASKDRLIVSEWIGDANPFDPGLGDVEIVAR